MTPSEAALARVQMLEQQRRLLNNSGVVARLKRSDIDAANAVQETLMLATADVFTWRHDLLTAALEASQQLPDATLTPDLLPCRAGLFLFPRPISLPEVHTPLVGIGFLHSDLMPDHIAVWLYESRGIPYPVAGMWIHFGMNAASGRCRDARRSEEGRTAIPDITQAGNAVSAFLMSSFLWLQQRILRATAETVRGVAAKQTQRLHVSDSVKVIGLRAIRQEANPDNHAQIEWSCQWFVRGHWRQQYLPSTKAHRPTWICPYVKGPDGKPIKAPGTTVFTVRR